MSDTQKEVGIETACGSWSVGSLAALINGVTILTCVRLPPGGHACERCIPKESDGHVLVAFQPHIWTRDVVLVRKWRSETFTRLILSTRSPGLLRRESVFLSKDLRASAAMNRR